MDFGELIGYLSRWGHLVFGIAWIGLLYYFNFVQGAYMAAASDSSKVDAFTKLVPRALWWFRWAALLTFLTGVLLFYFVHIQGRMGHDIVVGIVLGTLMAANVWFIIWPNQKVVIASNEAVAGGGSADPNQASAASNALLASRTNVLFSLPMLFFMGSNYHFQVGAHFGVGYLDLLVVGIIVLILEINAIVNKSWFLNNILLRVDGVIISSLVLTGVFWALLANL